MQSDNFSDYLTADKLAHQLGVTTRTLRRWQHLRIGPPQLRMGPRRILYRVGEFERGSTTAAQASLDDESPGGGGGPMTATAPAADTAQRAMEIWSQTVPLGGTVAEIYLRGRGIEAPALDDVRFHPRCPFGPDRSPAMIALMRDPITGTPTGIHRTELTPAAKKVGRMMLGPAGVVDLRTGGNVLYIAEGIETALSVMQSGVPGAVLATLSAGGIEKYPVLPGIETLTICADNDSNGVGVAAARKCARRWLMAGGDRTVTIWTPREVGTDWNDVLQAHDRVDLAEFGLAVPLEDDEPEPAQEPALIVRKASEIKPEATRWLWFGRFACGKVATVAGHPGLGKSQATLDIAARVSTGEYWPDGGRAEFGSVLLLSAEDDPGDTIVPRLMAAGANRERIHVVEGAVEGYTGNGVAVRRPVDLSGDIEKLRQFADQLGDVRLIVVDPISAYLGETNSHNNAEVRAIMAQLQDLAQTTGAAIICVSHLNKGGSGDAVGRVMGSIGFVAASRSAWLVQRDGENPHQRYFAAIKNNLAADGGTALIFHVEGVRIPLDDGREIATSRIAWHEGQHDISATELLASERSAADDGGSPAVSEAQGLLSGLLASGPKTVTLIKSEASEAGLSWRSIERAKTALKVESFKDSMRGGWLWALPGDAPADDTDDDGGDEVLGAWREVARPKTATKAANHSEVGGLRRKGEDEGETEVEI